jgi:hypothetical protein
VHRCVPLVALIAVLASTRAQGQNVGHSQDPSVDPSVEAIVSGGHWRAGDASGSFRLIKVTEGWDELRHRVYLQWLELPTERGATLIRASVELTPLAEVFSLGAPTLSTRQGHWYVRLGAAARPLTPMLERVTFEIGGPGVVRRVRIQ